MFNNVTERAVQRYADNCPAKGFASLLGEYDIDYMSFSVEDRISVLEAIMAAHYPPIRDIIQPYHFIQDSLYVRGIEFPAGTILTSRLHKVDHIGMLIKGSALVLTNYEEAHVIKAPSLYHCSPNTKRLIITLEDAVWCTVHQLAPWQLAMGLQDIDSLEDTLAADTDISWAKELITKHHNAISVGV